MALHTEKKKTFVQFVEVPSTYPLDEELIKLGLANQLQRLGLAEHFTLQIEDILTQVYR